MPRNAILCLSREQPEREPAERILGVSIMESNQRYYTRRAAEEETRAARALTAEAEAWHRQLAEGFARRARERACQLQH